MAKKRPLVPVTVHRQGVDMYSLTGMGQSVVSMQVDPGPQPHPRTTPQLFHRLSSYLIDPIRLVMGQHLTTAATIACQPGVSINMQTLDG